MRTLTRLPQSVGGESRVALLLLVIAVTGLPWGIMAQEWLDDDLVLLLMALLAVVTGFVLGRWPGNGLVSLLVGSLTGLTLTLILAGDLVPPLWLWNRGPELGAFWRERAWSLWARAAGWGHTAFSGGASYDNNFKPHPLLLEQVAVLEDEPPSYVKTSGIRMADDV